MTHEQSGTSEAPAATLSSAPAAARASRLEERLRQLAQPSQRPVTIPRRTTPGDAPLSPAQERLYFLQQYEPASPVYREVRALRLCGPLDVTALQRSLLALVERHEMLRTTFHWVGGRPVQRVGPAPSTLPLPLLDLRDIGEEQREAAIAARAVDEARQPYDLERGPTLRALLLKLTDDEHLLLLTMHHLICDGWSVHVLQRELGACYAAYAAGGQPTLPELPIRYADYAEWQANQCSTGRLEPLLGYWKQQLSDAPLALDLPSDHPRPTVQTYRGALARAVVPAALLQPLKALAQEEGCTLFMALLATFQAVLYRYTGQGEALIGVPVAGRTLPETEGLIGHFVNTLPLRANLSGSPSFRELLRRVRTTALEAYAHQELPFATLVEALRPPRDPSRPPVVQVHFQLRNLPAAPPEAGGLRIEEVRLDLGVAKLDLSLDTIESADGLECICEFNRALFDPGTIDRLLGHFRSLLHCCAMAPDLSVVGLPLLTEAEYRQLLTEWNDTSVAHAQVRCVHQAIEEQAAHAPEALAIRDEHEALTYGELNARANQVAHYLLSLGVEPETPVAICLPRSTAMVVAMLAVFKAGGAYVPLDPVYPTERLTFMLSDSQAPVLLTDSSLLAKLPESAAPAVVCLDRNYNVRAQPTENPTGGATPWNRAYVIYTSGSTGRPKGVEIEHRSLANLVAWHHRAFAPKPGDRASHVASPSFDASVWELWPPLAAGASLHLPPDEVRLDAERLRDWLLGERIDMAFAPTVMAERLLALPWPEQAPLRVLFTGGEALSRFPKPDLPFALVNLYGPTECTVWATGCHVPPQVDAEYAPAIGRPFDNVRVYVLGDQLQAVPIGVPGQLYIAGAGVGRGYLNRPELTAKRFVPEPFSMGASARAYATGDWVRYRADGAIEYLGRTDRQVKIRGFRIELGEIEATLKVHPDVRAATVACRADERGDKLLVAYVVGVEGAAPTSAALRAFLSERLPDYMVPVIVPLAELPLTKNGKVDQQALPTWAPSDAAQSHEAPRTNLERQLTAIWERVLGRRPIGVRDDFFALGGHSLLAAQLFAEMEQQLGMRLPLALLFRGPTIERLASLILVGEWLKEDWAVTRSTLVPIQLDGTRPPLFCVGGAQGEVLNYIMLAHYLGPEQPVFGLQARGLDGEEKPFATVEEMAAHYVPQIRSVQPEGPYYLAGYSAGGTVVFEIAQQLRRQGQEVALLALLDNLANNVTYRPLSPRAKVAYARQLIGDVAPWLGHYLRTSPDERVVRLRTGARRAGATLAAVGQRLGLHRMRFVARASRTRARPARRRATYVGYGLWQRPAGLPEHQQRVWDAFVKAVLTYVPQPYAGRVTFFRCRIQDVVGWRGPDKGWGRVAARVERHTVSGSHNELWAEPHVIVLAEKLDACLLRAQTTQSTPDRSSAVAEVGA